MEGSSPQPSKNRGCCLSKTCRDVQDFRKRLAGCQTPLVGIGTSLELGGLLEEFVKTYGIFQGLAHVTITTSLASGGSVGRPRASICSEQRAHSGTKIT